MWGKWVSKDAEFYADFKNICTVNLPLGQNELKKKFQNKDFRMYTGAPCEQSWYSQS
jgi:hypothetical protein